MLHAATPALFSEHTNVAYGIGPSQIMDVFTPAASALTGAVLMIHGGSWLMGDKSVFEPNSGNFQQNFANAFVQKGIAVFDVDYPLGVSWKDEYASVKDALYFVRSHASEFNINGNAIGAFGMSAGANLASMLGATGQVAFCVDNNGPVDLPNLGTLQQAMADVGLTSSASLTLASPIDHVSAKSSPFFIANGEQDACVNYQSQSGAFASALQAAGASVTTSWYTGGHSFANTTSETRWSVFEAELSWVQTRIAAAAPALDPQTQALALARFSHAIAGFGGR